jgi:hypothetical protein
LVCSIDFEKISELVRKEGENEFILNIYILLLKCFTDFDNDQHYFDYKTSVNKYALNLALMKYHSIIQDWLTIVY